MQGYNNRRKCEYMNTTAQGALLGLPASPQVSASKNLYSLVEFLRNRNGVVLLPGCPDALSCNISMLISYDVSSPDGTKLSESHRIVCRQGWWGVSVSGLSRGACDRVCAQRAALGVQIFREVTRANRTGAAWQGAPTEGR